MSGGDLRFGTASAEQMRITSAGNTLIGGTLPTAPNISLNADGSAEFASTITAGGYSFANLQEL